MKASNSSNKRNSNKLQPSNEKSNSSQKNKSNSKRSAQNQNVCAACLFQISIDSQDFCSTQCNHFYHQKCLEEWLKQKNTCCLCRQKITKYQTKEKAEIIVPEIPRRPTLFQLLMSLDISQRNENLSEIIFFNGDLNQPWVIISSNDNAPRPRIGRVTLLDQISISSSQSEMAEQNLIQNQHPITSLANNSLMQQQNQIPSRISTHLLPNLLRRNNRVRQEIQVPIIQRSERRTTRRARILVPDPIITSRKSKRLQQKKQREAMEEKKGKKSKKSCKKTNNKKKIIRKKGIRAKRSS